MSVISTKESSLGVKTIVCDLHGEYESEGKSFGSIEFWSPCPECAKELEKKENDEKNRAEKMAREKFYKKSGIVKRYWDLTLDSFEPKPNQEKAHKLAVQFCARFDEMEKRGQTLVFPGNVGTGKTRLASSIIQTLGFGQYVRAIDISRDVRATYTNSSNETEREVVQKYVDKKLLIIDEVGVQMGTDNERILLTDIIDRRYGDLHPTIICSNLNESQLVDVFGERAWSRLKQNYVICPIVGDDLRTGEKK